MKGGGYTALYQNNSVNLYGTDKNLCFIVLLSVNNNWILSLPIIKGKGKVFPLPARLWARGWVEVLLYSYMTVELEGSGQQHAPAILYPRERPGTHCTAGWVGPRDGLDGRENLAPSGFDLWTVQPVVSR